LDTDWLIQFFIALSLFAVSAFFSASEVALFSIDEKKLLLISKKKPYAAKIISRLLEFPRKVLITILFGNNLANVAISIILAFLTVKAAHHFNLNEDVLIAIEIFLLTIALLLIGEIIPKIIANRYPVEYILIACYPLNWIFSLLSPITYAFYFISNVFPKGVLRNKNLMSIKTDELKSLADISKEFGAIEKDEHDLISGIIELGETTVREVMTNRTEMVAVEINESLENCIKKFLDSNHSRLPVYRSNIDNIEGFIYIKDFLSYLSLKSEQELKKEDFHISKMIRPVIFVPESKKIDEMFSEFQKKKIHIAIVVDEFGGTAGLVTMEDILSEVVNRFSAPEESKNFFIKIGEDTYLVDAKISISDLEPILNIKLKTEDDDFDTLGGFLLHQFEDLPDENNFIEFQRYRFEVKEVTEKRIEKVLIKKLQEEKAK